MKKIFIVFMLLVGCAQIAVNKRVSELEEALNPLLGVAKQEDMVRMFGLPQRREKIGDIEFWYVHISYGQRASVYAPTSDFGMGKSWESYDEIILGFDGNGVLNSCRFFVQR